MIFQVFSNVGGYLDSKYYKYYFRFHPHRPQIVDHHLQEQPKVEAVVALGKNNPQEKSHLQT